MTTWNDLVAYVHNNYKIADEKPDSIKLIFELGGMRSQVVLLWHITTNDESWVQIESPIGELSQVDLNKALHLVGDTICGGLALFGTLVTFRHSLPLVHLNINEFEAPLAMVTSTADKFENELVGGDKF